MSEFNNKFLRKVRAILNPSEDHMSTLKPELIPFIGKEYTFQYNFIVEEGMFEGEWALLIYPVGDMDFHYWVPESDLKILEFI